MPDKKAFTRRKARITRIAPSRGVTRKSSLRKKRPAVKATPKLKSRKAAKSQSMAPAGRKQPNQNRAKGIRLFKLAGRPTKEQFVLVYGERGPKMTWEQRAMAGVPAEQFQAVLATRSRH